MATKKLPWLRLYTEMVDDEKLRLLAFEDRWHYVALLCLKGAGLLDDGCKPELRQRRIAVKLGLAVRELEEVARRLAEVDLIDKDTLQPSGWDARQFPSDSSSERVKAHRARKKAEQQAVPDAGETGSVTGETDMKRSSNALDTDTDTDTDTEKKTITRDTALKVSDLVRLGVDKQVASDYALIRKAKKLPLTKTALAEITAQAEMANLTLGEAIRTSVTHGWAGFKASWLQRDSPNAGHPPPAAVNDMPKTYAPSGRL